MAETIPEAMEGVVEFRESLLSLRGVSEKRRCEPVVHRLIGAVDVKLAGGRRCAVVVASGV
jgi:hypothetical protein